MTNETKKISQKFIEQNLTEAYKKQTKSISQKLVQKTSIQSLIAYRTMPLLKTSLLKD